MRSKAKQIKAKQGNATQSKSEQSKAKWCKAKQREARQRNTVQCYAKQSKVKTKQKHSWSPGYEGGEQAILAPLKLQCMWRWICICSWMCKDIQTVLSRTMPTYSDCFQKWSKLNTFTCSSATLESHWTVAASSPSETAWKTRSKCCSSMAWWARQAYMTSLMPTEVGNNMSIRCRGERETDSHCPIRPRIWWHSSFQTHALRWGVAHQVTPVSKLATQFLRLARTEFLRPTRPGEERQRTIAKNAKQGLTRAKNGLLTMWPSMRGVGKSHITEGGARELRESCITWV